MTCLDPSMCWGGGGNAFCPPALKWGSIGAEYFELVGGPEKLLPIQHQLTHIPGHNDKKNMVNTERYYDTTT